MSPIRRYSKKQRIEVGTVFKKSDWVDFGTNYINHDDYWGGVDSKNKYQGIVEIGTKQCYSFGQYMIYDTSDELIVWVTSTYYGSDADIRIKVKGGAGTYSDPFCFEILAPAVEYTVTWKNADGSVIKTDTNVPHGEKAVCDLVNIPEDKILLWSDGENIYLPENLPEVTADVTYTAIFRDIKTLQSNAVFRTGDIIDFGNDTWIVHDDQLNPENQKMQYSGTATLISPIYLDDYSQYTFNIGVEHSWIYVSANDYGENVVLSVKDGAGTQDNPFTFEVLPIYTVTFNSDNGNDVVSQEVYGTLTQPETPVKDGYTFVGWYNDGNEPFDFNTTVTEDITLTAKWYKNIVISETNINGITTPNIINRETFIEYSVQNAPYLDGYEFEGWKVNDTFYTQAETVKSVVESLVSTDTEIAVAVSYKKLKNEHKVSFDTVGCTIKNADGETKENYQVSEQLYATADQESPNQKFSHWVRKYKDGTEFIVGYETTYAFRMPDEDMVLSAIYVPDTQEIQKEGTAYIESVKKTGDNKISFVSVVSVPDGAAIKRAGLVISTQSRLNGNTLTAENSLFKSYDSTNCQNYSSFKYTFTVGNVSTHTLCARAYLVYEDTNGEHIVYGNLVSKKISDFSGES